MLCNSVGRRGKLSLLEEMDKLNHLQAEEREKEREARLQAEERERVDSQHERDD